MKNRWLIGLMIVMMLATATGATAAVPAPEMGYRMLPGLYDAQGQFVFSPLSLKLALSMAAEGAKGETREQLLQALGVSELTPADLGALTQLRSANAAIVNADAELIEAYAAALTEKYGAEISPMADDVMEQVNGWVSEKTDGLIPELLSDAPDPNTMLILLNALVLKADWAKEFDPAGTNDRTFHAPDGDKTVPFMYDGSGRDYAEANGAQAVKMPYVGDELEMVVILPKEGGMADMLQSLSEQGLDIFGEFAYMGEVRLSLPKFQMESTLALNDAIKALGVADAFDGRADFSGIAKNQDLFISAILQKAKMDVDEQGTVAAAATSIQMDAKSLVMDSVEMTIDRPFIALVREAKSGALVFAAVVENP